MRRCADHVVLAHVRYQESPRMIADRPRVRSSFSLSRLFAFGLVTLDMEEKSEGS